MTTTKELKDFLDESLKLFKNRMKDGLCPCCGIKINPETDFKDQLSIKEYTISGMCQKCQDSVFESEEDM